MWQTSFYLFGSIGIVWSLIWISLYSEKDCENNDELPLLNIPHVSYFIILIIQYYDINRGYFLIFRILESYIGENFLFIGLYGQYI